MPRPKRRGPIIHCGLASPAKTEPSGDPVAASDKNSPGSSGTQQPASKKPANETSASGGATAADAPEKSTLPAAEAAEEVPPGKHPLDPALDLARKVMANIQKNVKDYTCIIIKQERIGGQLLGPDFIETKIRRQPLSVYMKFIKPAAVQGREVIYIAGANEGKFVVRDGSGLKRALGALWLEPTSALAMIDNRYPISNVGLEFLTKRLIEIAQHDRKYGEAEVHFFKNAKVNDRVCTLVEVVHPTPRRNFLFHKARVYIDDELQVPIRYEAYLWPKKPGDDPPLDESYTYLNLKLNVGLIDADFDYKNERYGFLNK